MTLDELIELAKEVDVDGALDWGMIPVKEEVIYYNIATKVVSIYNSLRVDQKDAVMLAWIIKLIAETFIAQQHNVQLLNTIDELNGE